MQIIKPKIGIPRKTKMTKMTGLGAPFTTHLLTTPPYRYTSSPEKGMMFTFHMDEKQRGGYVF